MHCIRWTYKYNISLPVQIRIELAIVAMRMVLKVLEYSTVMEKKKFNVSTVGQIKCNVMSIWLVAGRLFS